MMIITMTLGPVVPILVFIGLGLAVVGYAAENVLPKSRVQKGLATMLNFSDSWGVGVFCVIASAVLILAGVVDGDVAEIAGGLGGIALGIWFERRMRKRKRDRAE